MLRPMLHTALALHENDDDRDDKDDESDDDDDGGNFNMLKSSLT